MTHIALALMITLTTAALMTTHLRVLSAAVVLLLPRLAMATMMISTFTIITIMEKYNLRHKQALACVEVTLPPLLLDFSGTQVNKFSPLSKSQ